MSEYIRDKFCLPCGCLEREKGGHFSQTDACRWYSFDSSDDGGTGEII